MSTAFFLFWSEQGEKFSFQNGGHGARVFDVFGFFYNLFLVVNLDL